MKFFAIALLLIPQAFAQMRSLHTAAGASAPCKRGEPQGEAGVRGRLELPRSNPPRMWPKSPS